MPTPPPGNQTGPWRAKSHGAFSRKPWDAHIECPPFEWMGLFLRTVTHPMGRSSLALTGTLLTQEKPRSYSGLMGEATAA